MIRSIVKEEISKVLELFADVVQAMIENHIHQWDEVYPHSELLMQDIKNSQAYGYYIDEVLAGYVVINEFFDEEYNEVDWQFLDEKPLVVHRLAVKSEYQGRGIAKEIMTFAENFALENDYSVIRLDAFSQNPAALTLYRRLNYCYAGKVEFRKGIFYCFEKRM